MRVYIFVLLKSSLFHCFQLFENTYACACTLVMYNGFHGSCTAHAHRLLGERNTTKSESFFAVDFFCTKENRERPGKRQTVKHVTA